VALNDMQRRFVAGSRKQRGTEPRKALKYSLQPLRDRRSALLRSAARGGARRNPLPSWPRLRTSCRAVCRSASHRAPRTLASRQAPV